MARRLIQLYLPDVDRQAVEDAVGSDITLGLWTDQTKEGMLRTTILVDTEHSEEVLDALDRTFGFREDYRLILLPVVASLPRPDEPSGPEGDTETPAPKKRRVSREELYTEVRESSRTSVVYVVMVLLSTVVAAIGMLRDNVAVIVGAMVIAPLLGPNVALSLATSLADGSLARRAITTGVVGAAVAFVFSIAIGMFGGVELTTHEIASRTTVSLPDIALALAAGAAGALSFTSGVPAAVIGVMVAVALLPPLVAFGMLLGAGHIAPATGAMLLFFCNVISVNLAGVITFMAQGMRPAVWHRAKKAKKASFYSMALWVGLLAALAFVIVLSEPGVFRLQR